MNNSRKLVIATANRDKAREITAILEKELKDLSPEILTLADFPDVPDVEETGTTYAENATIKAEHGAKVTGLIALGDDVGLEVDHLNGEPGLYSRRFAGEHTSFKDKMRIILDKLEGLPDNNRGARFRAALAVAIPEKTTTVFESAKEGRIADSPNGLNGFGYDPIFYLPDRNCTMAELPTDEKNKISHRALVLQMALPYLRELLTRSSK